MAGAIFGDKLAVTGTATTLSTLLGLGGKQFFTNLIMRADTTNTGRVWFGKSDVTVAANQLGYINAGEWFSMDVQSHYTNTDEMYLIGTVPGDLVYVLAVS